MREFKGKSIIALPSDYVVIDTETTGYDYTYCNMIEVCAIRYKEGQPVETFSSLIQPPAYEILDDNSGSSHLEYVDKFITELTGITNDMLASAPLESKVIPSLLDFIGDCVLIGHNVNFDINFVYDGAERCGRHLTNDFIDTLRISRKVFPDLKHHRLSDIADACHVQPEGEHRSEYDCHTTAQCYEAMRQKILEKGSEREFQKIFAGQSYRHSLEGITVTADSIDDTNPIYEKIVVFTGTLASMERKAAFQLVANLGGIPQNGITKKTNFLVVGSDDFVASVKNGKTNKMKKAEEYRQSGLEITTISEDAFFDMIENYISHGTEKTKDSTDQLEFCSTVLNENSIFKILKGSLAEVVQNNNVSLEKLIFKEGKSYSSVWYDTQLAFRICCRDGHHYFGLSDIYANSADTKFSQHITTDGRSDGFSSFSFVPTPEGVMFYRPLLTSALDAAIDAFPKEFDCCSRFEKCSDAMKCINPNPNIATGCGYRKIMKKGRIFHGKNRNIT